METTDTRAWLDARMRQLRKAYADGTPLPDGARMTVGQLRRLHRALWMEHDEPPREETHGRA